MLKEKLLYGLKWQFQDPVTSIMERIIEFHNGIMFYMVIVVTLVFWMLTSIIWHFGLNMRYHIVSTLIDLSGNVWSRLTNYLYILLDVRVGKLKTESVGQRSLHEVLRSRNEFKQLRFIMHGQLLEIIWTITPSIVLVCIAVPSFAMLYSMEELVEPALTLKVIGYQWYWSYEYVDYLDKDIKFDSYMVTEDSLELGDLRLLEVDNPVFLPVNTNIRVIVTAADVLHCWAVPSFGVKMDCVPGRLNQTLFFVKQTGIYYGQCSELCGVNHGFMPIAIRVVPESVFDFWVQFKLSDN